MNYTQIKNITQGRVSQMGLEVYDLMAEDHIVYAKLEKNGDITTIILSEEENLIYKETSHHAAWDSLVYFAKQVIDENDKIKNQGRL